MAEIVEIERLLPIVQAQLGELTMLVARKQAVIEAYRARYGEVPAPDGTAAPPAAPAPRPPIGQP